MKILQSLIIVIFAGTLTIPLYAHASDCFEASILSPTPFMGNDGEIFKLDDGSLWEVKYEYEYLYEYYPSVIVCPGRGKLIIDQKQLNIELISSPRQNKNKSGTGGAWEIYEETNLRGTISGIVKKGSIFKTLSGSIYEVTGVTIQVVVEVQPDVTVLRNGNVYKLVIEGFDEPLICQKLK